MPAPVATDGAARWAVAERRTTQHVNERLELDTVSPWLTGYFTLRLNRPWPWSHGVLVSRHWL